GRSSAFVARPAHPAARSSAPVQGRFTARTSVIIDERVSNRSAEWHGGDFISHETTTSCEGANERSEMRGATLSNSGRRLRMERSPHRLPPARASLAGEGVGTDERAPL